MYKVFIWIVLYAKKYSFSFIVQFIISFMDRRIDCVTKEICVLILLVATDLPSELEHSASFNQNFPSIKNNNSSHKPYQML